jgi:4,5-dihydroxyphthalate decarboxylase
MAPLAVSVAFWNYDRTMPIADGRVQIDGCTATCTILRPQDLFPRAFGHAEFDISELSLSRQAQTIAAGTSRYVGLPIFPSRAFRHASIYIRDDHGIEGPRHLIGRRIGLHNYDDTAAVVARGMLRDEYGLGSKDITWVIGDLDRQQRPRVALPQLYADIPVTALAPGETLDTELAAGRLDGVIALNPPPCFFAGHAHVRRLFPDWCTAEQEYFRRTGLFPIMHLLGVRASLLHAHPWIGASVMRAFEKAKAIAYDDLGNLQASKCMLPWVVAAFQETQEVMGVDYWPYGLEPNRSMLAASLRHLWEDGLLARHLSPEDMFPPRPRLNPRVPHDEEFR